jgi:hypothetical protein
MEPNHPMPYPPIIRVPMLQEPYPVAWAAGIALPNKKAKTKTVMLDIILIKVLLPFIILV